MNLSFLAPAHDVAAQPLDIEYPPLQLSVCLTGTGLATLRKQIERDINAKGFGINPIPYRLLELLDIERLLRFHSSKDLIEPGDNVQLTHDQRQQLFAYANRHYLRALDCEDDVQERVYIDVVHALSNGTTLLTRHFSAQTLIGYDYRFLPEARPLVLLWGLVRAVFSGRRRAQVDESIIRPAQAFPAIPSQAMSVQEIINTGQVDESLDTELLQEASARIDRLVLGIQESNWGPVGEAAVKKYQGVAAKILEILNHRYGADGMTPLTSTHGLSGNQL